jgi:hypothetical protein
MDERVPIGWFSSRLPYVPAVQRNCETPDSLREPFRGTAAPLILRFGVARPRQLRDGHGGVGLVVIIAHAP